MRTVPKKSDDSVKLNSERIKTITRKVAVAFILIIQLAIIFKMLI